ncbi:hydroxyisourate hydrolase [Oryzibacter oryziterrae]|uniref:hydroxyisourate hydrolase n=1 Tax=Oryzibacter oryziterrae TaxID=2766474 RepID=UPI0036F429ED
MGHGRLTTHVLDTALGKPAAGLVIDLFELPDGTGRIFLKTATTNADGRVDQPLLAGDEFRTGQFELVFHAGDYLRKQGTLLPQPPFLDIIPIRFGIADAEGHYHVPLLLSPFSYSTYRGS